jgi:hypothetical protein
MAFRNGSSFTRFTAIICSLLLCSASMPSVAQNQAQPPADDQAAKIPNEQLDSLVAPIALYPDPLLAQVLAASTYPLEIIQLQQWLAQHKDLKDQALVDAVKKQDWDPTVQAMAPLPDVVKRLADDIKWTTELGNAVLAQESDVMDAVQRMRAKAQEKGNLKSSEQMTVETKVVENKQVIVVEQADPQVVYVPSYDPVVVYGAPVYPYPPIYYPPYYAGGVALAFGVGIAMGAAWGGGWCCNSGWGGNNNININNNNNFINNGNRNNVGNRPSQQPGRGGNSNWKHNGQHRGGAPYSNKGLANKYGGTTRGASISDRQSGARQQQSRQQGRASDRAGGGGNAGGRQQGGVSNRASGGGNAGGRQQGGVSNRASGGGGGDRVGNRSVSGGGNSRGSGGFGGGSGGYSGSSARSSSSRGSSSMGGGRSGGGGGGGRSGGGGRGGGGGRRR